MNGLSAASGELAVSVRLATIEDAGRIAELSSQLGYPASAVDAERRLKLIADAPDNVVIVAALPEGPVIGWLHAYVRRVLESEPSAEIGGLVVDEQYRGQGAGRLLMEHVERWAQRAGCTAVSLRSNILRDGAHRFYQGLGYTMIKTQHAFRKKLDRRH